ncbi:MAG: DNA-methyltransferase [Pikeienuella sp.]
MIFKGDCIEFLSEVDAGCAQLCVTSPPYNIGKEYEKKTDMTDYLGWIERVALLIDRAIAPGGSIFWQVGNTIKSGEVFPLDVLTYPIFSKLGLKLRNRIVWSFNHGLHCKHRFSGRHETALWFTKGDKYKFNLDPVRTPSKYPNKRYFKGPKKGQLSGNPLGKNPGDVWDIPNVKHNHPEKTDHPCQFPEELVRRAVLSTSDKGDLVIDPFLGSGTTAVVCDRLGRKWTGSEKKPEYWPIIENRLADVQFDLSA